MLIDTKKDVRISQALSRDLLTAAETGIGTATAQHFVRLGIAKSGDPNAVEFRNVWFSFARVIRKAQVEICSRIMIEKWGCSLGGLAVAIDSHCFTAVVHMVVVV